MKDLVARAQNRCPDCMIINNMTIHTWWFCGECCLYICHACEKLHRVFEELANLGRKQTSE